MVPHGASTSTLHTQTRVGNILADSLSSPLRRYFKFTVPRCERAMLGARVGRALAGHKYCAEPSRLVAFANAVLRNPRFNDEVQQHS